MIRIENLRMEFEKGAVALDNINLEIEEGEFILSWLLLEF